MTITFEDIKIGEGLTLNGYPMELLAVGNLLIANHQRVEIVILQKLEGGETPWQRLIEVLRGSGFSRKVQREIILAALDVENFTDVKELSEAQCEFAINAIESAMVDRDQLEEDRDH